MAVARGSPLLPVHSMKHTKKRRGSWGIRILILTAVCLTVGYGFFAVNYVGKTAQRKTHNGDQGDAPVPVANTAQRTLQAEDEAEGTIESYDQLADDGGEPAESAHEVPAVREPSNDIDHSVGHSHKTETEHIQKAKAHSPDLGVSKHETGVEDTVHVPKARSPDLGISKHEPGAEETNHVPKATAPDVAINSHKEIGLKINVAPGEQPVPDGDDVRRDAASHTNAVPAGKSEPETEHKEKAHAPVILSVHGPNGARVEAESDVHGPKAKAPEINNIHIESEIESGIHPKAKAPEINNLHIEAENTASPPKAVAPGDIHTHAHDEHQTVTAKQAQAENVPTKSPEAPVNPSAKGLYALEAVDIDGKVRKLSEFAGKVTIVVNVASACGFTDENYKGLMEVYKKYHSHGLEILGFPCNQFGNQESGSESEIKSFCSDKYHVTFPMFSKVEVNGPNTHPVYKFLKTHLPESEGGGGGKGPGKDLVWNFNKFIVDQAGNPVKFFYQNFDRVSVENAVYNLLHSQ